MDNEIKEILEDNDELIVRYKDNSFECFDTLPKNVLDYITNLQQAIKDTKDTADDMLYELKQENERLKEENQNLLEEIHKATISSYEQGQQDWKELNNDYKYRCEKAIECINKRKNEVDELLWVEMRAKDYFEECDEIINILQNESNN